MSKENNGVDVPDAFEETRVEVVRGAQQIIKDYLMPLQTKKLSKKMIEQIAEECANQIALTAVSASRKASGRQAAKLTRDLSQILMDQKLRATAIFNDKLAPFAGQLASEDIEKIKADREIAARVVSRVYKSIFDFANEIGHKPQGDDDK